MSKKRNKRKQPLRKKNTGKLILALLFLGVAVIFGGMYFLQNRADEPVRVVIPSLSAEAKLGEAAFNTHCAACHGLNAAGSEKGPSLVDTIYRPAHHAGYSFVRAATLGVRQHHWFFGSMPPVLNVTREEIDRIVVYVRELQRANGIH